MAPTELMSLSKEEKKLIKRLFLKDPDAEQEFIQRFAHFVSLDTHYHARIGLVPDGDNLRKTILMDFLAFVRESPDIPTEFSIAQILHLMVVDKVVRKHLMHYHGRGRKHWTYEGEYMPPSFRGGRLGLLRVAYDEEGEVGQRLVVDHDGPMTPRFLSSVLIPYVGAISEIQEVCNAVLHRPPQDLTITSISQNSPMDIKLLDAAEAINALKEDIIPWRRKNAKILALLKEQELAAEVKKKEAEALELRSRTKADSQKARAEVSKIKEEAEQMRLENEKRRFELQKAKFELALDIVSKMQPDLPMSDRYVHAMKLLPAINTLATSDIEPKLIS